MYKPHDLVSFFDFYSFKIQKEYEILSRRVIEDPGTAGDQGEENWKDLFRKWIPPDYTVVTKGRILNMHGEATKQWDVIVLKPGYPTALIGYKHYLSTGVFAVFECKTTLRKHHIREHMQRAHEFKKLLELEDDIRIDNLKGRTDVASYGFAVTHSSIHTGLLAHTTVWRRRNANREDLVDKEITSVDEEIVNHPRYMTDFICIADTAAWAACRSLFSPGAIEKLPGFEGIQLVSLKHPEKSTVKIISWHKGPRSGYHLHSKNVYKKESYPEDTYHAMEEQMYWRIY